VVFEELDAGNADAVLSGDGAFELFRQRGHFDGELSVLGDVFAAVQIDRWPNVQ
jgi:hypothetical protein